MDGEKIMGFFSRVWHAVADPIAAVVEPVLEKIDDTILQPIGEIGTKIDEKVNEEIPGGWYTVGAVALGGAGLAGGLAGTAGLTAAESAALAESSALADSAMIGAEGLTAGEVGSGIGTTIGSIEEPLVSGITTNSNAISTAIPDATLSQYELSPITDFSPDVAVESVSPEFDPTGSFVTPEKAPIYDFSPETPVQNVSPELDPTGSLANTGITGKDIANTLRTANTVKNVVKALTPQEQALKNAQTSQQQMNMANMLRGTQMPQTALPPIYKQANPFNFGQQNQPVQDTTALANLLRTA